MRLTLAHTRIPFMALLTVLAAGSVCYSSLWQTNAASRTPDTTHPDAFLTQIVATQFNAEGHIERVLRTPHATHYPLHNQTDLETPHLVIHGQSPKPWTLHAVHGRMQQGTETLMLWDHVIVSHPKDRLYDASTIRTTRLTVYPGTQRVITHAPITLTQPGMVIQSVGLSANLRDNTLTLLSDTRGRYEAGLH